MKKFGTVILAAALATTSLTGCSEGGNDKVENTSANNGTVTSTESTASPSGETSYTASDKNVKQLLPRVKQATLPVTKT